MEYGGPEIKKRDLSSRCAIARFTSVNDMRSKNQSSIDRAGLLKWLANHRELSLSPAELIDALAHRLMNAGIPVSRAYCTLRDLNPQILARTFLWHRDRGGREADRLIGEPQTPEFFASPIHLIYEGAEGIRRRLSDPATANDFPILDEIRAEGGTDYVAMPLRFTDGSRHFLSWATDQPNGFTTEQLSCLYDLLPVLCLRLEVEHVRHVANALLQTYLGRGAAERVVRGAVHRGTGRATNAIIFFSDLRGFTRLADTLPTEETIRVLNEYYDAISVPVQHYGGDILKLIGDGLLAIFPLADEPERVNRIACGTVSAARHAIKRVSEVPSTRLPESVDVIRCGIALHVGEVMFGNVGTADRLDFTAIGPAVNETVRVESLSKVLDQPILTTAAFARLECSVELQSLGFHALRGVREPKELFAPKSD